MKWDDGALVWDGVESPLQWGLQGGASPFFIVFGLGWKNGFMGIKGEENRVKTIRKSSKR